MEKINRIETFDQVNYLHKQGVNLCKGCQFEHTASCGVERLKTCNLQYAKLLYIYKIIYVLQTLQQLHFKKCRSPKQQMI